MKNRKNRICIVCEFPPPPGGMSNQALMLKHYLKDEGLIVRTCQVNITFPKSFNWLENYVIAKILLKLPLIIYRLLINIVKSDIIHIFWIGGLYFYVVVTPAIIISKIFNKRIIANYHAGYFRKFYDESIQIIVKNILKMADHVTTPLYHLDDEFSSIGIHIKQVPNVIDQDEFSFKKRNDFSPRFISSRHLRNVYGNDTVIRAFKIIHSKYPQGRLMLAGDGYKRKELEELTHQLGVQNHVVFTGYIDKKELLSYYDESDIFLNGSRRDNMPISILEAFSLGLPVVSTNPMGIPFLVSDGMTGLLTDVDDFEQLAEYAMMIIEDTELGKQLTKNAKQFVNSLTWPNVYPILSKVYFD